MKGKRKSKFPSWSRAAASNRYKREFRSCEVHPQVKILICAFISLFIFRNFLLHKLPSKSTKCFGASENSDNVYQLNIICKLTERMRALFFLITGDVFMIQICFEKFDDIGRLVDHGSRHLAEGDLSCSYCGQELSSLAGLAMHQLHQPAPHPDPAPSPGLLQDCAAQGGLVAARAAKLTGLAEQCGQHAALLVGLEMAAAVGEEGTLSAQLASWKHHLAAAAGPEELRPVIARLEAEVCFGR